MRSRSGSAKEPERFGKGAIEGIVAPESANNAADQTAFIPTHDPRHSRQRDHGAMLGVLIIHGIQPGPSFIAEQPDMFWGLVMSFWIGNLMLLFLNIPLIGLWVRILTVPYTLLYPAILMFICIGVYSDRQAHLRCLAGRRPRRLRLRHAASSISRRRRCSSASSSAR